jgi:hypothetical protein
MVQVGQGVLLGTAVHPCRVPITAVETARADGAQDADRQSIARLKRTAAVFFHDSSLWMLYGRFFRTGRR